MSRVFGALFHFDCRLHILSLRQSLLRLWTHLAFSSFPFTESREPKRSRRIVASEIHSFACVHVKLLFEHVKPTFHRVSMYDEEKKFVNITLCISIERPKIAIVGGRLPFIAKEFFWNYDMCDFLSSVVPNMSINACNMLCRSPPIRSVRRKGDTYLLEDNPWETREVTLAKEDREEFVKFAWFLHRFGNLVVETLF